MQKNSKSLSHRIPVAIFVIYSAVMVLLLFGRSGAGHGSYVEQLHNNLNTVPLKTVTNYLYVLKNMDNEYLLRHAFINLAGNVVMFVPLGLFLPWIYPKLRSLWRFLLAVIAIIIAVEAIQLFTLLGSCDVDDLILNVVGASVGFIVFRIGFAVSRKLHRDSVDK